MSKVDEAIQRMESGIRELLTDNGELTNAERTTFGVVGLAGGLAVNLAVVIHESAKLIVAALDRLPVSR